MQTTQRNLFNKIRFWLTRRFGTTEQKRLATYREIINRGVGDLGTEGWNLSVCPEEAIEEALAWMNEKIRLARAPYGNSVILVKVAPVNEALTEAAWEQGEPIPPFPKQDWPEMRTKITEHVRLAADQSPVKVAAINIFNFGDVLLKTLTDYNHVYVKNSRGS